MILQKSFLSLFNKVLFSKSVQKFFKIINGTKILSLFLRKEKILKNIGGQGNFYFDIKFAFSDFKTWGIGRNNGFKTLLKISTNKSFVFDLGAHIGLCTFPISRVLSKNGYVYSFEPSSINRYYLRKHKDYNKGKNILIFPYLVGEKTKYNIPFFESNSSISAINSCIPPKANENFKLSHKYQISLDDFCKKKKIIPEVIKIDVEGAELNVLKGAKNILMKNTIFLVISVHPSLIKKLNQKTHDLIDFIHEINYEIYEVNGNIAKKLKSREYIACPREDLIYHEIFKN